MWYGHSKINGKETLIRRAEIAFSGKINDTVGYTAMIDPSKNLFEDREFIFGNTQINLAQPKSDDKILQDLFVSFNGIPRHVLHVGQMHIPIGMEGLTPSGDLDFPERAIVSGAGFNGVQGFGDARDIGAKIEGDWDWFKYTAGVFNGEGLNASDANSRKDLVERLVITPTPWLHLGASRYDGKSGEHKTTKRRTGAELGLIFEKYFFKAEYIQGRDLGADSEGSYASTGYRWNDLELLNAPVDIMAAVRYESFDPDMDVTGDTISGPTVGVSVFLKGSHAKFQASYTRFDTPGPNESLLIVAFQVAF